MKRALLALAVVAASVLCSAAASQDGRTIVYTTDRTASGDIYAMRSDGRDQRRLTTSGAVDVEPSWWQPRLRPASATTMSADSAERAALAGYLSGMSWPVRAALLRAGKVSAAIHGALTAGDPPFFGGVGLNCRKLRAVEPTGRRLRIGAILKIDPVVKLRRVHARLAASYSGVRVGCVHARLFALAARDASEAFGGTPSTENKRAFEAAIKTARAELSRFEATGLTAFRQGARQWRTAVRAYSRSLGVRSPTWLEGLSLSD
jgi:hypothetical protein